MVTPIQPFANSDTLSLTIKDARRLDAEIMAEMSKLTSMVDCTVTVNIHDPRRVQEIVLARRAKILNDLADYTALATIRSLIRDTIKVVNSKHDIDRLLLQTATSELILSNLKHHLDRARGMRSQGELLTSEKLVEIQNQIVSLHDVASKGHVFVDSSINVMNVFDADTFDRLKNEAKKLEKQITNSKDKIGAFNATTTIVVYIAPQHREILNKRCLL